MKKKIVALALVASCMMGVVGCSSEKKEADTTANSVSSGEAIDTYEVTYVDQKDQVLETEKVEAGQVAPDVKPEKEGYEFMGYYVNPECGREIDMTAPVVGDKKIYCGFTKPQKDERKFYVVGAGKSEILTKSNWGETFDDTFALTKDETSEKNVYTITVELSVGDEFQFITDKNWSDQRGFGYLKDGKLDGEVYFKKAAGLGDSPAEKSNIHVEKSGKYEFTLTTYPASDVYDTENEYYTEETKENFNSNPFDTIEWKVVQ